MTLLHHNASLRARACGGGDTPRRLAILALVVACGASGLGCGSDDGSNAAGLFALTDGTAVALRLTAIEAPAGTAVSVKVRDTTLNTVGQSAALGVALDDLHTHPEWVVTVPGGLSPHDGPLRVSFTLSADAPAYDDSKAYTVQLALVETPPAETGEDVDIEIGSTKAAGGQLAVTYDFNKPIALVRNQCLGGGQNCAGGVWLYGANEPGFEPLE